MIFCKCLLGMQVWWTGLERNRGVAIGRDIVNWQVGKNYICGVISQSDLTQAFKNDSSLVWYCYQSVSNQSHRVSLTKVSIEFH